jgi:hypothetical protein
MWDWVIWSDECYIIMGEKKGVVWVTREVVRPKSQHLRHELTVF